jgi:hypothetical protein
MNGKTDRKDKTGIRNNFSENRDLSKYSNRNIPKVPKNKTRSITAG